MFCLAGALNAFKDLLMRCALSACRRSSSGCATCSSIPVAVTGGNPQSFLLSKEAQALVSPCTINRNCHVACTALDVCQVAALPCLLRSLKELGAVDPEKLMAVFAAGKTRFISEILENFDTIVDLSDMSGTRGAAVCQKGALLSFLPCFCSSLLSVTRFHWKHTV